MNLEISLTKTKRQRKVKKVMLQLNQKLTCGFNESSKLVEPQESMLSPELKEPLLRSLAATLKPTFLVESPSDLLRKLIREQSLVKVERRIYLEKEICGLRNRKVIV